MAEDVNQYIGEIRLFAGSWIPTGWLPCDGRELPINSHTELYLVLRETYGGHAGYFRLPDMRDRIPIGTDRDLYPIGDDRGDAYITLGANEGPAHTHRFFVALALGTHGQAFNNLILGRVFNHGSGGFDTHYLASSTPDPIWLDLNSEAITLAPGGTEPHENRMPTLVMNYIIATSGTYPSR